MTKSVTDGLTFLSSAELTPSSSLIIKADIWLKCSTLRVAVWCWWLSGSVSFPRSFLCGVSTAPAPQSLPPSLLHTFPHSGSVFTLNRWQSDTTFSKVSRSAVLRGRFAFGNVFIMYAWKNVSKHIFLLLYCFHVESQWKTSRWSFPPCMFGLRLWRRRFKETRSCCSSWSLFCRWRSRRYVIHHIHRHTESWIQASVHFWNCWLKCYRWLHPYKCVTLYILKLCVWCLRVQLGRFRTWRDAGWICVRRGTLSSISFVKTRTRSSWTSASASFRTSATSSTKLSRLVWMKGFGSRACG